MEKYIPYKTFNNSIHGRSPKLQRYIIGLAIFGFILKDTYYASRKYCTPYEVKNSTDSYFSHISVAILIIRFAGYG
jgi:hypothetical protein